MAGTDPDTDTDTDIDTGTGADSASASVRQELQHGSRDFNLGSELHVYMFCQEGVFLREEEWGEVG